MVTVKKGRRKKGLKVRTVFCPHIKQLLGKLGVVLNP
jgi:hypothetical protein